MSSIDEIKQRTDIVEVVSQYASLKKAGRNLMALCPFHSEKHPSFFVYPEQQSWHCFGACNTGGDVFSFIMRKEGVGFGESLRILAQRAGVSLPSRTEQEGRKEEKEELYQINEAAARYFNNLLLNSPGGEKVRDYVSSRGFSPKTVADFQLGFSLDSWESLKQYLLERGHSESTLLTAGLLIEAENGQTHDRFRGKLMFPIRDIKGRTIGFGARVLDDSLPKYINSPQTPTFDKSGSLYGIDLAATTIRQQDTAIIMEGYMDVITAHQNNVTNVVASMGTSITEKQVNILKRLTKNVLLAFDADIAGNEASRRGGEIVDKPSDKDTAPLWKVRTSSTSLILNEAQIRDAEIVGTIVVNEEALNIDARVIKLPEDKDPDEVIKEDINTWQKLTSEAVPIIDYIFDKTTAQLDLNNAKDKSQAVSRLLPIVVEIKDPVRQAHYLQKLANLMRVSINTLEAALSQLKPSQIRRKITEPTPAVTRTLRPLVSNLREEYCLALLLQFPELKLQGGLLPEYFESSENREIFTAWREANDLSSLKETLDLAIHEHLEAITSKSLPAKNVEQRYADCVLELKKQYLRKLAAKRAEILALEAEVGGIGADLAKLEEEGIELKVSTQLREIFARKNRSSRI